MASEDQQKWQEASSHVLCANNCGFFGSPTTLNLCSKCYKDHCVKDHQIETAKIAVENTFSESSSSPRHQSVNFSPELPRQHEESFSPVKFEKLTLPRHQSETFSAELPPQHAESLPDSSFSPVKISGEGKLTLPRQQLESFSGEDKLVLPRHQSGSEFSDLVENDIHAPHAPIIDIHASEILVHAPKNDVHAPVVEVNKTLVRNRCGSCNKRVGLTGFTCKCGTLFCGTHRYPEKHECSFDFKTVGKEAIKRENPVVKASKLNKI